MSDVADDPGVRERFPVIAQALLASASAQVRNMASIGGNLLQRTAAPTSATRPCPATSALRDRLQRAPGRSPPARDLRRQRALRRHAPSDLAVALVALDAVVLVEGPGGERRIPIEEFHRLPGDTPERDTVLEPGELILAVEVPASAAARRSHYLKIRDRASFEFALVSVAAGWTWATAPSARRGSRPAASAPSPGACTAAEAALAGRPPKTYQAAADRAVEGASPLLMNGFKVELLRRAVGARWRPPEPGMSAATGEPHSRVDGPAKVTGAARYAAEFSLPDLAYGAIVQSTIAKGRITAIDTAAAARPACSR